MSLIPCYCQNSDEEFHRAAHADELPDYVLVNDCCYTSLCRALCRLGKISYHRWVELSRYRGSLFGQYFDQRRRGPSAA